ncbi:hypothetical protein B0A55_04804 [Friedmanniomyces simplex]|uniref:Uncharacterized protein n=1 Tax=Friedmanniomyces simplex TaxID=329884 RepID=A0A4U0XI13_9PEZI|nr:hypothetical protein B0A55_04804 [Friedmanniomyces simplex]
MHSVNDSHRALSAALLKTCGLMAAKHARIVGLDGERAARLLSERDQMVEYAAGLERLILYFAECEQFEDESARSVSLASVETEDDGGWGNGCEPVREKTFFTVDEWHVAKGAWVEAWLAGVSDEMEPSGAAAAATIADVWTPELSAPFPPALDSDGFSEWEKETVPRYVDVSEAKKLGLLPAAAPEAKRKVATGDIWGDLLSAGASSVRDSLPEAPTGARGAVDAAEMPATPPASPSASPHLSATERFTGARGAFDASAKPATPLSSSASSSPASSSDKSSSSSVSPTSRLDRALAHSEALLTQARAQLAHEAESDCSRC